VPTKTGSAVEAQLRENQSLPAGTEEPRSPGRLGLLKDYKALAAMLHRPATLSVFGQQGVQSDFAALLELNPDELHQLEELRLYVQAKLAELRLSHLRVDAITAQAVKLSIAPFPQESDALNAEMKRTLEAMLGPERTAEMQGAYILDGQGVFEGMGMGTTTYEVNLSGARLEYSASMGPQEDGTMLKQVSCNLSALKTAHPDLYARLLALHPELATTTPGGQPQG